MVGTELGVGGGVDAATGGGVDGVGVLRGEGDAFDDVDFAAVGPASGGVGGDGPPGGPDSAANGHVGGVEDEDSCGEGVVG